MATWSSKHGKREQTFFLRSFSDGLVQETSLVNIPPTALSRCKNMRYILDKSPDGQPMVALATRQGTELLSNSALPSAADVRACTYYIAGAKYILATAAKLYYLDASYDPVEIGDISGVPTFTEFHGKLIIHDSGVTKAWDGTTFETLTCLYQNESLGTGNNSTVDFSGTLAHPAAKVGSLTITYTDGTAKTITDDGDGTLSGDGTGTINYTTGAWAITCSGAPDNTTTIYAEYEKIAGAPKSKAGFVRASRLYMWGDADNPSRMWYSGPNDEDGWDSSSSGGYLDVDPLDGHTLVSCLNLFQSIVAIKERRLYRINDFPGDSTFTVKPLMDSTGCIAYRTALSDGNVLSFLSSEGWVALSPTNAYGDITRDNDISARFQENAVRYGTANCYAEYNQNDRQLWLTLYDGAAQWPEIYVVDLGTGGQLSLYQFAFGHTCYKFVNGRMLIGGSDGNLYRLYHKNARFLDNGVSYSTNTYVRGAMTDFSAGFNRKHNKRIYPHIAGKNGATATLNIYTDGDWGTVKHTVAISLTGGNEFIWEDQTTEIYDDSDYIFEEQNFPQAEPVPKKFNYSQVMFELTDITGSQGVEFYGIDFTGAIIGR